MYYDFMICIYCHLMQYIRIYPTYLRQLTPPLAGPAYKYWTVSWYA